MKSSLLKNKLLNKLPDVLAATGVFVSRLGLLPANISPLGSLGFFGNPVLYFVSILAFDFLVKGTYAGFWVTYLGFACYPLLGWLAKGRVSRQLVLLPLASLLFFLVSNFGVWLYWYDHTFAQLLLCYSLAVPFYARTLAGDLLFGWGYLAAKRVEWSVLITLKSQRRTPSYLVSLQENVRGVVKES